MEECELRNVGTDKYSVAVTQANMLTITEKRDYLHVVPIAEGKVDIVVTNNETGQVSHTAHFDINGEYEVYVPPIKTVIEPSVLNIAVGESKEFAITNDGGNYALLKNYPNITVSQISRTPTKRYRVTVNNADHAKVTIQVRDQDKDYSTENVIVNVVGASS